MPTSTSIEKRRGDVAPEPEPPAAAMSSNNCNTETETQKVSAALLAVVNQARDNGINDEEEGININDDTTNTTTNNINTNTSTNEGGTAATPKTTKQNNKLNLPDTVLRGPSSASEEHPTTSTLTGPRIGGGELFREDKEKGDDVVDAEKKIAAEKVEDREIVAEGTAALDVQSQLTDEERLTRALPQSIIVDLISPNRIRFGSGEVYELTKAVNLEDIVPSEEEAILPELTHFDVNMSRTDRPNDGMYFILLLCPGGKWKVLYGVSEGNITCDGLFLRVKSHLSCSEQVGEVLFVEGIMKRKLKILEAMMKMSAIECRPEGGCGTEIALFDSRAEAIGFIGYFSSQVKKKPSEVNMHFSYAKHCDSDGGGDVSYITLANIRSSKRNEERYLASQRIDSTRTIVQINKELSQIKRDKFNSLSFDEKVEHIKAEFNARPEPEDGEQDRRMKNMKDSGPMGDWLRELAEPNTWGGLTNEQQKVLEAAPFNIHPNRAAFAIEQRKANALEKRRIGLQEFQEKYCDEVGVGVRPLEYKSGNMMLTKEEISLGSSIAVDLRIYRRNKDELSKEMLALYRKFKLTEFDNAGDTTNHTLLTAQQYDKWRKSNSIRRSGRRHDQNEPSDVSLPAGTTTRRSAAAATTAPRSTATRSSKKRTSATTSNPPKRIKKSWSDEEKKKLEVLENKYGTAWLYFERDPDCLPGKSKEQMSDKWGQMKKDKEKMQKKNRDALGVKLRLKKD